MPWRGGFFIWGDDARVARGKENRRCGRVAPTGMAKQLPSPAQRGRGWGWGRALAAGGEGGVAHQFLDLTQAALGLLDIFERLRQDALL